MSTGSVYIQINSSKSKPFTPLPAIITFIPIPALIPVPYPAGTDGLYTVFHIFPFSHKNPAKFCSKNNLEIYYTPIVRNSTVLYRTIRNELNKEM